MFAVDEGWTDMKRAARNGDAAAVRRLLEEGGDPNAQGGQMGLTPLIVSAANGHREIVELLLTRGASLEAADSAGMTPLMNAVMFDQTAVVQLLLDRGANVNAQTRDGNMTPLMFARSSAAAKVLLLNGLMLERAPATASPPPTARKPSAKATWPDCCGWQNARPPAPT